MLRLVIVERQVLTGSLHTVPKVGRLSNLHKFEWTARSLGSCSEEIVRDFYVSYVATLRGSIYSWVRPSKQDPLTFVLVWGCRVDICKATISRLLYEPTTGTQWTTTTQEFYYWWETIRSGAFQRTAKHLESIKKCLVQYLSMVRGLTECWIPEG